LIILVNWFDVNRFTFEADMREKLLIFKLSISVILTFDRY